MGAPVSETPAGESTERAAVVDLLGVLAYGQLIAFERLADDARLAPTLLDKAALGGMAVAEYQHFELIERHLRKIGVDPVLAMAPFVTPLDDFHDLTAPSDWLEGLVKAFVGDGIGTDFYREVSTFLDDETQALVVEVLSDERHAQFAIDRVRAAIEADPAVAGRLALWARRLVGEALVQAQRVAVDREALTALIVGGAAGAGGLVELGRMLARLTEAHTKRMAQLGLRA
ncbi:ferritin-like domain-containing protein [Acidothermaceae bacterium B102]|nr:ferritin-like domain-containing protein [Acidothermaceae bacterium B102]